MELWVRTQGKDKLVKIEYVQYVEGYDPIDEYDGFTTNEIWANEEEVELGQYKTKERCLEIIDEIQNILTRQGFIFLSDANVEQSVIENLQPLKAFCADGLDTPIKIEQLETAVYEMPEE